MSISFQKKDNKYQIREPLFQINRIKFKSERSSLLENLETNILKIDLTRIFNELEKIDISILDKISYFNPSVTEYTEENKLNDGVSYTIGGLQIYIDDDSAEEVDLQIDTTDKISGKLSRLFYKIKLLENGN